jgi:hypothetical protein
MFMNQWKKDQLTGFTGHFYRTRLLALGQRRGVWLGGARITMIHYSLFFSDEAE